MTSFVQGLYCSQASCFAHHRAVAAFSAGRHAPLYRSRARPVSVAACSARCELHGEPKRGSLAGVTSRLLISLIARALEAFCIGHSFICTSPQRPDWPSRSQFCGRLFF